MGFKVFTQEQAIAHGYLHCVKNNDDSGNLIKISEIEDNVLYRLITNDAFSYHISEDLVFELLENYLSNQEDVSDEDGELIEIARSVDYKDITHTLNEAFEKKKYYYTTSFYLKKYTNSDEK